MKLKSFTTLIFCQQFLKTGWMWIKYRRSAIPKRKNLKNYLKLASDIHCGLSEETTEWNPRGSGGSVRCRVRVPLNRWRSVATACSNKILESFLFLVLGGDLTGIRTQSVFCYTVWSIILGHRMTRRIDIRTGVFPLHMLFFSSVQSTQNKTNYGPFYPRPSGLIVNNVKPHSLLFNKRCAQI
jgi:hypothetical protein